MSVAIGNVLISDAFHNNVQMSGSENSRIKLLERELAQYRYMLDKMVLHRTEMLERRLSIMESCNSALSENYHQMHKMYLGLLVQIQIYEQICTSGLTLRPPGEMDTALEG